MTMTTTTSSLPTTSTQENVNEKEGRNVGKKKTWCLVLLLAMALGLTGLLLWGFRHQQDKDLVTTAPQESGDDAAGDSPVPEPQDSPDSPLADPWAEHQQNKPDETEEDEEEDDEEASSPTPQGKPTHPIIPELHNACESARPLPVGHGSQVLGDHLPNPTLDEARTDVCKAATSHRAVFYKIIADGAATMSLSVARDADQVPILVSVARGDDCNFESLECVGFDYNAMTWEAEEGEQYIVMFHQLAGTLEWYLWYQG